MRSYRVYFEHAPFAWVQVKAANPQDAETKCYQNMMQDFLGYLPWEDLQNFGEATVEEVPPGS